MDSSILNWIAAIGLPLLYVLGALSAVDAIMKTRTPQGATAWALALSLMPLFALPAYWIFGRDKFDDYIKTLRDFDARVNERLRDAREGLLADWLVQPTEQGDLRTRGELRGFRDLATHPFTRGNSAHLLIDGRDTFDAIFEGIDAAQDYVLAQFYIIRDDDIGQAFKMKLLNAARRGVRVYLLFDEIGSHKLSHTYVRTLKDAGIKVAGFGGNGNWLGRFRLNFRNHRKIVIVDGVTAFMGGLNVGDEYLGRDPKISPWRDTHLKVEGPAVLGLQYSFMRDWYYTKKGTPSVRWDLIPSEKDQSVLVLASGPADELETCGLLFTHAIESAEKRVWLATPYFVPDGRVLGALQLAALRGVDVRVMMPRQTDSVLFKYVPYAYLPEVSAAGVKVYLYEEGFMHQKVLLVDHDYAAVSSANLDNRSFRLNFEITCLINDRRFSEEMATMLEHDFERATRLTQDDLEDQSFSFRLATQSTRLLAPVL